MGEYTSTGLIWIRLVPGEKPMWIGGNLHEDPPREIAHRFANTTAPGQDAVREIMRGVMDETRREVRERIDRALKRHESPQPTRIVEGRIAR